jgi:hypothetical protein
VKVEAGPTYEYTEHDLPVHLKETDFFFTETYKSKNKPTPVKETTISEVMETTEKPAADLDEDQSQESSRKLLSNDDNNPPINSNPKENTGSEDTDNTIQKKKKRDKEKEDDKEAYYNQIVERDLMGLLPVQDRIM